MRIGLWLPMMNAIYICIDWIISWARILGFVHKHDLVVVCRNSVITVFCWIGSDNQHIVINGGHLVSNMLACIISMFLSLLLFNLVFEEYLYLI